MNASVDKRRPVQHEVRWDDAKVSEFWKVISNVLGDTFFSHTASGLFLDIAKPYLGSHILDVGCGDGHLVREMRARGYDAIGVDPAPPESPYLLRATGSEIANLGESRFDTVVSLETFEHVFPDALPQTFEAIAKVLRPGGHLVFTVPSNERLTQSLCVCPDCHAVFHRWQHLQSFSHEQLAKLLQDVRLQPIRFRDFVVPPQIPLLPRQLRPALSLLYARAKKSLNRDIGVLVAARRTAAHS